MTTDKKQLLEQCGQALFGTYWRVDLAAALNVSERTVRRWAAGAFDMPDGAWVDIKRLLAERGKAIRDLEKMISPSGRQRRPSSESAA